MAIVFASKAHRAKVVCCLVIVLRIGCTLARAETQQPAYFPPVQVTVKPVFLIPRGATGPSRQQRELLTAHLKLARERYQQLLRTTFEIAKPPIEELALEKPLQSYQELAPAKDASAWTGELLQHDGFTRWNCPFVYVAVVCNDAARYPLAGGRPFNGGINTGGGIVVISTYAISRLPNFQSTLQHELGHAFGLPHVDVYGYSMKTSTSMMSYNPAHKTAGLRLSSQPGRFLPEDRRGLALNDRAMPHLDFRPAQHVPQGYRLSRKIITLGPMDIDGQPDYGPLITTKAGEKLGTKAGNLTGTAIAPSRGPGVTFDKRTMWHSAELPSGVATLDCVFPLPVRISRWTVCSEHSGQYHRATKARLEARVGNRWQPVGRTDFSGANADIQFSPVTAKAWRLHVHAGPSRQVVLRGLRFFAPAQKTDNQPAVQIEIFPPRLPIEHF